MFKYYIKCFGILLTFAFIVACSKPSEPTEMSKQEAEAIMAKVMAATEPTCEGCVYDPIPPQTLGDDTTELSPEAPTEIQEQDNTPATIEQWVNRQIDPIFDAITYYLVDEPAIIFTSAAVVCVKPCTIPGARCSCEETRPAFDYLRPKLHKKPVGDIQKVKDLLQQGSDVNATDAFGRTPLMLAAMGNSQELINLLLEYGADINAKDFSTGKTALQFAKDFKQKQTIKTLQQHGAK